MAVFRLVCKGGETVPVDFGRFMMVTISKAIIIKRQDPNNTLTITIKYTPLQSQMEKSEVLASFYPGQSEVSIENIYYDAMNPKIFVPEGNEVKFEGNFISPEQFADKSNDESESSIETPDDEEDGDFQEEDSY